MDVTDQQKQAFSGALSKLREAAGLTPDELAERVAERADARVQRQDISNWETGKHLPRSRAKLDALDDVLNAEGTLIAILTVVDLRDEVSSLRNEFRKLEAKVDRLLLASE